MSDKNNKKSQPQPIENITHCDMLNACWAVVGKPEYQEQWDAMLKDWGDNPCSPAELCKRALDQQGEDSPCWHIALAHGFVFNELDQ